MSGTVDFTIKLFNIFTVERLKQLGPDDLAELYSGQFEGDMVMSSEEIEALINGRGGRTGLIDQRYKWADNVIPYKIEDGYFSMIVSK